MEIAKKNDQQKIRFSLIPQLAIVEVIKGFEAGALKYGSYNYSNGMEHTRYTDAAWRHMHQYLTGEDVDEETKVHHLGLVACNALMALENIKQGKGVDNRNKNYIKNE
jgi:hypothetical protein